MGARERKTSSGGRVAAAAAVVIAALAAMPVLSAAGAPRVGPAPARAAGSCPLTASQQRHSGPTYLTSLSVTGTGCAQGLRVAQAYYRCRVRSGGAKGYCRSAVLGYRCSERRQGISIQFDSRVTCVNGRRRVLHTYTQDT